MLEVTSADWISEAAKRGDPFRVRLRKPPSDGASRSGTAELLLSEDQSEKSDVAEKVQRHVRPDSDINVALPKDRSDVGDHRKQDDHVSPRLPDVVEGEEDVLQERVFQRKREIRGIRYPRK